jgi:putative hydrolase of the HAD superfamily
MAVAAVLFDGFGTLFDVAPSYATFLAARLAERGQPCGVTAVEDALTRTGKEYGWPDDTEDPKARAAGWHRFATEVLTRVPVPEGRDEVAAEFVAFVLEPANYRLYPDSLPALDQLRDQDIPVGLVSNFDSWLRLIIDRLGLRGYLSAVSISGETGYLKPDARAFRVALDQLGIHAADALFVGDSPYSDIAGARLAGMTALLVDRGSRGASAEVIAGLTELSRWVPSVGRRR